MSRHVMLLIAIPSYKLEVVLAYKQTSTHFDTIDIS